MDTRTSAADGRGARTPSVRTRKKVVDAARRIMRDGEFRSLTMEGVAREASVSKATVYRWWSNRASVAMEVLLEVAGPGTPYLEPEAGPLDNLRLHIRIAADFLGGPDRSLLTGIVADMQHDPELAEAFRRDYLEHRRSLVKGLMRDAIEVGDLGAEVDPDVLTDRLIGPLYYRLLLGHAQVDRAFADEIFDLTVAPAGSGWDQRTDGASGKRRAR